MALEQQQQQQNKKTPENLAQDPEPFDEAKLKACMISNALCIDPDPKSLTPTMVEQDIVCPINSDNAYLLVRRLADTVTGGHVSIYQELVRQSHNDTRTVLNVDSDIFMKTGREVAVKVFATKNIAILRDRKHAEDAMKEISAMQLISNKYECLMGCKEVLSNGKYIFVVMKYCSGGDLFDLIVDASSQNLANNVCPGLTESQARTVFRKLVKAVHTLHSELHICHR
jgi:serine/threonine protein kinase